MVVANAVAALAEIHEVSGKDVFQITNQSLFKLLRALNECTEWGQVRDSGWAWSLSNCDQSLCLTCLAHTAQLKLVHRLKECS